MDNLSKRVAIASVANGLRQVHSIRAAGIAFAVATGSTHGTSVPVGSLRDHDIYLTRPIQELLGSALSGANIVVRDTQIVITNEVSGAPFCFANTVGTACVDVIDGFDFKFTGENILGVAVDPASASGFLPVTGTFQGNTHLGLQLLSNNEIQVDATGDLPLLGDQLILDLSFTTAVGVAGPIAGAGLPGLILASVVFSAGGDAAEDRLNIRRKPHTSFAAASDCGAIAIYEYTPLKKSPAEAGLKGFHQRGNQRGTEKPRAHKCSENCVKRKPSRSGAEVAKFALGLNKEPK